MTNATPTFFEWRDDPETFAINRLPAHAVTVPFPTEAAALAARRVRESDCYLDLNGTWRFQHVTSPAGMSEGFWQDGADLSAFGEITVPLSWQLAGYGRLQYTNTAYPWEIEECILPPRAPSVYNEVGSYVRTFTLPDSFRGKRVILSLQGVESAFYLWVNGTFVGYAEDTYTPSEFDLTAFLREGENTIALRVFQWCTGSWLEDQDMWRLGGIFRDVYLYAVPQRALFDFSVHSTLDSGYRDASLSVALTLRGDGADTARVLARLYKPDGSLLAEAEAAADSDTPVLDFGTLENPEKWSAEVPNLYTLTLTLLDPAGAPLGTVRTRIGFRCLEVKNSVFYINGQRAVIKGMCKHDIDWERGRAVTFEKLEEDIRGMKRANINSIRTSHYPTQTEWADLCDEYGIYLADEVNLESHGSWFNGQGGIGRTVPGNDPRWTALLVDRCSNLFHRDHNHPCVILWSLGNESFGGENLAAMSNYFHENDAGRFTFYESTFHCPEYGFVTDMENQMYMRPNEMIEYANSNPKKPFITCEYQVCMGNSYGNLFEYIDLFDNYDVLQGGYLWLWRDSAIKAKAEDGSDYFGYGGDFGERLHDGTFCCNGVLLPDSRPTPKLRVLKHAYRNFNIRLIDFFSGRIEVYNKNLFVNLNAYDLNWSVLRDGKPVASGTAAADAEPLTKKRISLWDACPVDYDDGSEYFLNVSVCRREGNRWSPAGWEDSLHQMAVTQYRPACSAMAGEAVSTETYGAVFLKANGVCAVISRRSGALLSVKKDGKELLAGPCRPNFWRAMTDADIGSGVNVRCAVWRQAGESLKLLSFKTGAEPGRTTVEAKFMLPVRPISSNDEAYRITRSVQKLDPNYELPKPLVTVTMIYSMTPDGALGIDMTLDTDASLPEIPEISYLIPLDRTYQEMQWYGNGPEETYWDRPDGSTIGIWEDQVDNRFVEYVRPQECGNITEVRWLTLTEAGTGGRRLSVSAGRTSLEVNALPYAPAQLESVDHPHLLPKSDGVYLRAGLHQMGLAGDDVWSGIAHEPFMLRAGKPYRIQLFLKV